MQGRTDLRLVLAGLVVALAFLAPAPALAQGGDCFVCADDAGTGCEENEHTDSGYGYGPYTGRSHDPCFEGSCDHIEHDIYGLETLDLVKAEIDRALRTGSDALILKALMENSRLKLNAKRSGLQLYSVAGLVVLHVPLETEQSTRIVAALQKAEIAATRVVNQQ